MANAPRETTYGHYPYRAKGLSGKCYVAQYHRDNTCRPDYRREVQQAKSAGMVTLSQAGEETTPKTPGLRHARWMERERVRTLATRCLKATS
jgi:hypothetical protein